MNEKIFIICGVIFLVLVIYFIYKNFQEQKFKIKFESNWGNKSNQKRHNTFEYDHAHFSEITEWNESIYPSLKKTNPKFFELNPGEALYIPKKWWHWVKSEKCLAINYWWENKDKLNKPNKLKGGNFFTYNHLSDYYNEEVNIWNSENDKGYTQKLIDFLNSDDDYRYIITLDHTKWKRNNILKNYLPDLPDELKNKFNITLQSNIQKNLWISSGKHDTGLHFDDNDGLLYVASGKKTVILFPPSDSDNLLPYNIVPVYATGYTNNAFKSNLFMNGEIIPNQMKMSRLLYETLNVVNAEKITHKYFVNLFKSLPEWNNKTVYGVKWDGQNIRWEIYYYFISEIRQNIRDLSLYKKNNPFELELLNKFSKFQNLFASKSIISFDIYDGNIGSELHLYDAIKLDCYKVSTDNDFMIKESDFIYIERQNLLTRLKIFLDKHNKLNLLNEIENIFNIYQAETLFFWIKYKENGEIYYLFQWCGINFDQYINFLIKRKWPIEFINFCIENKNHLKYLSHEIGEAYSEDFEYIRSAFYGVM